MAKREHRKSKVRKVKRAPKRPAFGGTHLITPRGLEARYGWSPPTRWRAERDRRVPARDVFIGGRAVGWKPSTIEAAESAQQPGA
jgi:predicted DNA-binding transcriptional regulator AlpA